ncbi:unnamed protein product [Penicillium camemberti]|uniref:Str. FM013 n=1 Tax=Penicillium camemberti (strain FM 013) TaxID=1429867 RepID=A0A0G4P8M0_PENC3|nr:unnamed protein product [Penicillium camemberti]
MPPMSRKSILQEVFGESLRKFILMIPRRPVAPRLAVVREMGNLLPTKRGSIG